MSSSNGESSRKRSRDEEEGDDKDEAEEEEEEGNKDGISEQLKSTTQATKAPEEYEEAPPQEATLVATPGPSASPHASTPTGRGGSLPPQHLGHHYPPPYPPPYYSHPYPTPPPHGHPPQESNAYPPPPPRGYEHYPPPYPGYYMPPPHYYPSPYHYGPPPHHLHHPPSPYYPDPNAPPPPRYGGEEGPGSPYPPRRLDDSSSKRTHAIEPPRNEGEDDDDEEDDPNEDDEENSAVVARLKTYIKSRNPTTQEVLDRRQRKNAQSRSRAAKLRSRILDIELKPESERTDEELRIWEQYEVRRQRKNDRSRERALEKKEEIDRILAKQGKKSSKIERQFLDTALSAKQRKNEGDRLRRQRLKDLGISSKGTGVKPGISARGPLPPQYQQHAVPRQHPYMHPMAPPGQYHMQEIPMSPLPSMPHSRHHHGMASPGGFGSPGMMPYPSPRSRSLQNTPSRPPGPNSMPYMPPQPYEHHSPDRVQPSSRVEQRRNPDGSVSISIGGERGGERSYARERRAGEDESGYNDDSQGDGDNQQDKSE